MSAGRISIIGTAAGFGVRTDGNLAASAGKLTIDAAGNLPTGATYGRQGVELRSGGDADIHGDGWSEADYSVTARGGIEQHGELRRGAIWRWRRLAEQ